MLLNQASCREKNGQLATAWGLFLEAGRQTRAAADEATKQWHRVATSHAAKLEPRLSTLTIAVATDHQVRGLEILRDAEPVDRGAWNKALPIDGGTYQITAGAPGNAAWSSTIIIGNEHDAKAIEIPKLKAAALDPPHVAALTAVPYASTADATERQRAEDDAPSSPASRRRTYAVMAAGTGVGLIATGLVFGNLARGKWAEAKKICGDDLICDRDQAGEGTRVGGAAHAYANVSTGLVIGGAVALGVGGYLWFTAPSQSSRTPLRITPGAGTANVGLTLQGGF